MSKKLAESFGKLATALEEAAQAVREIENANAIADAKSSDGDNNAVASSKPGPKGSKTATAPVAEKPAKGGKAKAPAVTFDILKAKLTELVNIKGKEAAKDILSDFGAAKLVDLDEENYAEAHSKAVALLAADETDSDDDADNLFGDD